MEECCISRQSRSLERGRTFSIVGRGARFHAFPTMGRVTSGWTYSPWPILSHGNLEFVISHGSISISCPSRATLPLWPRAVTMKLWRSFETHMKVVQHHIRYFGRFPVSQFNESLGGVDLKCTQWVQFRSTQPKLYFPKIMEFSHYNEYGVVPWQIEVGMSWSRIFEYSVKTYATMFSTKCYLVHVAFLYNQS